MSRNFELTNTEHPFDAYSKWNFVCALSSARISPESLYWLGSAFSRSERLSIKETFMNDHTFEAKVRSAETTLEGDIVEERVHLAETALIERDPESANRLKLSLAGTIWNQMSVVYVEWADRTLLIDTIAQAVARQKFFCVS